MPEKERNKPVFPRAGKNRQNISTCCATPNPVLSKGNLAVQAG
jgi:hypothetical protein